MLPRIRSENDQLRFDIMTKETLPSFCECGSV